MITKSPRRSAGLIRWPTRNMYLHEFQAFNLLKKYDIPVPRGRIAFNAIEAYAVAQDFGPYYDKKFVVKAQIMKTARSKGFFRENGFNSGIHKADTPEQVRDLAA